MVSLLLRRRRTADGASTTITAQRAVALARAQLRFELTEISCRRQLCLSTKSHLCRTADGFHRRSQTAPAFIPCKPLSDPMNSGKERRRWQLQECARAEAPKLLLACRQSEGRGGRGANPRLICPYLGISSVARSTHVSLSALPQSHGHGAYLLFEVLKATEARAQAHRLIGTSH